MTWRFTLIHDVLGSVEISEPGGWKDHKLVMTRHPEFFSLVESLETELLFYGSAAEFIYQVEAAYGFEADLRFFVELDAEDCGDFVDYFDGYLPIHAIEKYPDNRCAIPPLQNLFWAKFLARYETPVNLSSSETLDGTTCSPAEPVTVRLTPQKIRYSGAYTWDESFTYEDNGSGDEKFYQIDWDKVDIDDLQKFFVPRASIFPTSVMTESSKLLAGQFEAPYDGTYTFDIRIVSADLSTGPEWVANTGQVEFRIGIAGESYTEHSTFTESSVGPYAIGGGLEDTLGIFTFQGSFELKAGEQIVIYGRDTGFNASGFDRTIFGETRGGGDEATWRYPPAADPVSSYCNVTADTTFPESEAQGYLIHDLFFAVAERILN